MKKYTHLSPALPWIIPPSSSPVSWTVPGTPPARTLAAGDIDGDSRTELVVINTAAPALSLISYFEYGDVDRQWVDNTEPQLVNYFAFPRIVGAQESTPSWVVSQNDQVWCADIDGDGQDEILIFNPAAQWLGVLEWKDTQLQCVWATNNPIPGSTGAGGWDIYGTDQHFIGDFDGDNQDEILVYSPATSALGILKWDGAALQCSWMVNGMVPSSGRGEGWYIFIEDQYFVANFDGGHQDVVLAFSPLELGFNNRSIGVLKWNGTELQCIWEVRNQIPRSVGEGDWNISAADQYFTADFGGQRKDAILVFNPATQYIGVLEWDDSQLNCVWLANNQIPGSAGEGDWNISLLDQHFVAGFGSNGQAAILVFNPADQWIGVLEWNGTELQCVWKVNNQIPGSAGQGAWNISATDQYFVANLDGGSLDEIVVINPSAQWIGALQWNGSELQTIWSAPSCFPAWNLGLITSGPVTPFPYSPLPINGMQETQIYQHISEKLSSTDDVRPSYPNWTATSFESAQHSLNSLPNPGYDPHDWKAVVVALSQDFIYGYISDTLDSACQGNIRGQYNNLNNKSDFSGFAQIADNLATQPPADFNFSPSNSYGRYQLFSNVARQIASECSCINPVMNLIDNMNELASYLKNTQEGQLNTVVAYLTETLNPTVNQAQWWIGQFTDALLWGAAATPFGAEAYGMNIALSVAASLFGSLLSSGAEGSNNPTPPAVLLSEFESQLDKNYGTAISNNLTDEMIVLGDPVKPAVVYPLTQQAWKWPADFDCGAFSGSAQTYRLYFYQQLIPLSFQIMTWSNVFVSEPSYVNYITVQGMRFPEYGSIGAPSQAYLTLANEDGTHNIYMLYQGSDDLNDIKDFKYPDLAMMGDLFITLGVLQSDFFTGANGWKIPTVTGFNNQ